MIPPMAIITPSTDLSPMARPDVAQPRATIEHVLTCPTTVLDTGPVWAIMKNWEMLISEAKPPDCRAHTCQSSHSRTGAGVAAGGLLFSDSFSLAPARDKGNADQTQNHADIEFD